MISTKKAKNGEIDIMIGPRSALFTPFSNLGIIIIDEEHEESYKSETVPRYHARETAQRRAEMEGAKLILGSATPSVESYYRAEKGRILLAGDEEAGEQTKASVCLDWRYAKRDAGGQPQYFKPISARAAWDMSRAGRSGDAVFKPTRLCRFCGMPFLRYGDRVSALQRVPVTSQKGTAGEKLVCHYCGYTQPNPRLCPSCGSPFIGSFQVGTQQVVSQVQRMFPKARILRMDADTTRGKDGHHKILETFAKGGADILVGTQMIVKGHDFADVTLVGALAADLSLHMSDYRAAERTFQLLTQAAGRAGRGEKNGKCRDPDL